MTTFMNFTIFYSFGRLTKLPFQFPAALYHPASQLIVQAVMLQFLFIFIASASEFPGVKSSERSGAFNR